MRARPRNARSAACLAGAAILLIASIFFPYWRLELVAPQYPDGLRIHVYANRLAGDVAEIDAWNRHMGVPPLGEMAELERSLAVPAILALALLAIAAGLVRSRWALLLGLPAASFPVVFLLDLAFRLAEFGQQLDRQTPFRLERSTPALFGQGAIGPFESAGGVEPGWLMGCAASILILSGLWLRRRRDGPTASR